MTAASDLRFTCAGADLRRAVTFAAAVVRSQWRCAVPIMAALRIESDGAGRVTVTGTDLDSQVRMSIPAEVSAPGVVILTAEVLRRVTAWADAVTIAAEGDNVSITADDMTAALRGIFPAADWPDFPTPHPMEAPDMVPRAPLVAALRATLPCVSTEGSRYYLHGVYLHGHEGQLRAVSTDGHRLARYDTGVLWDHAPGILPMKAGRLLAAALKTSTDDMIGAARIIRYEGDAGMLSFAADDWTITSKVIDGTFPDYHRVIAPACERDATATVALSAAMLRRLPARPADAIKIDGAAGRITLIELEPSPGGKLTASIPAAITGAGQAGFRAQYLRDLAAAGPIRAELTGTVEPTRILSEDPAFLGVLMPMRVK